MDDVNIAGDTIRLGQLLKLANLIDQGADAKLLLANDDVRVNGDVETRRGRQLIDGDIVEVGEASVRVVTEAVQPDQRGPGPELTTLRSEPA